MLMKRWAVIANGKNLDPLLIMEWNESLKSSTVNTGTLSRYQGYIRAFLAWMKGVGAIKMDPSLVLSRFPQHPSRRMIPFTHSEYERIVAYGEAHPERYALVTWLVVLSYHTGFSFIDCCHLRWDEVFIDPNGPCYIQRVRLKMQSRTGNRSMCTVPIIVGGELWNWLLRLSKAHMATSDFVHPEAVAFYQHSRVAAIRHFPQLFNAALGGWRNRKGRTFRCLRNTFCSRLLNAGVDPILVSKMTGHTRLEQLSVYVTPDIRVMQEAVLRGLNHVKPVDETLTIPLEALSGNPAGH